MNKSCDEATSGENTFLVKKRVGGGYKYVEVKQPDKPERKKKHTESEKHELEEKEKEVEDKDLLDQKSPNDSFESISLPLSSDDFRRENTCDGKIRYDSVPILRYIQDNVIGHNLTTDGPFGKKKIIYCDYTASGRCLSFIEDYIRTFVCPYYANTHSETGRNARQTSKFREEARSIIRKCVNAGKDDVVIFTGSGATAALHKLAWGLKINQPRVAEETVILTGPYEHHANMLLWKEFGTTVVRIRDKQDGAIDVDHLTTELKFWKGKKRHIHVCMSAASNVTGIITDTDEISRIAHHYGATVAFDYAGGGPYLKIDMNSSKQSYNDAVFISPHKFVGGPGTPGVIVAKKWMFRNSVPDRVGGGTVVYVTRDTHAYTSDIEAREEGGTPAIIESIRTGLAFQLKSTVGEDVIAARDEDLCCRAFSVWERNPNLVVLGSHKAERITIFAFIVKHEGTGKYVHFNFVCALLNDLFGIQSRGGCVCAGPYTHDLLGISEPMAKRLKWFVNEQPGMDPNCPVYPLGIMRPGFVRVNLPYFYDDETVDYIITAVDMVATHGWKLLPLYTFNPASGSFVCKEDSTLGKHEELFSLADIDYKSYGKLHVNRKPPAQTKDITLSSMLQQAEAVLADASENVKMRESSASLKLQELIPKGKRGLRWFLTPQEVIDYSTGARKVRRAKLIMTPRIDSRHMEPESAPDTYRSQVSERDWPPDNTVEDIRDTQKATRKKSQRSQSIDSSRRNNELSNAKGAREPIITEEEDIFGDFDVPDGRVERNYASKDKENSTKKVKSTRISENFDRTETVEIKDVHRRNVRRQDFGHNKEETVSRSKGGSQTTPRVPGGRLVLPKV